MQPIAHPYQQKEPQLLYVADQVIYPRQPSAASIADMLLTPLRVALQGRIITCRGHKLTIESATHHLALRILAGFAALVLFPITLTAYLIKWICVDDIKRDLSQLISGRSSEEETDEFSIGNFFSEGMPLTKLENFSEPLVDIEKLEIEFYEFFDRSDRQEVKAWIEKIGELIKKISTSTSKKICVFEYFGMGQGDYYYLDRSGHCRVINSEDLKYSKGSAIEYAREQIYHESFEHYTLLMPGRREVLSDTMRL